MQNYSIKELRHLLINEKEFDKTKDYFFDWIGEHNNTAFATPTKNKMVLSVLKGSMSKAFQKDIVFKNATMFEIKRLNFVHGQAFIENMIMAFFYFTDLDWGMIMTADTKEEQGHNTRFRVISQEKNEFYFSDRQN